GVELRCPWPRFFAVMLPAKVEQTEDQGDRESTEAVRHDEIHWWPPSATRQDRLRHKPAALGCAPRGRSARHRRTGWTSFLTGACLQLQFAWRAALRRQLRRHARRPLAPRRKRRVDLVMSRAAWPARSEL